MSKQASVERDGVKKRGLVPVVPTTPEERAVYATPEEAREQRPTRRAKWRLFTITDPAGKTRYTWSPYKELAVFRVALVDGYSFVDPGRMPSKDKIAALLAALPPEDRAELIATYKKAGRWDLWFSRGEVWPVSRPYLTRSNR